MQIYSAYISIDMRDLNYCNPWEVPRVREAAIARDNDAEMIRKRYRDDRSVQR